MPCFENVQQLNKWLSSKGIDTTQWGINNAKSVEDLWVEIVAGEAEIQDNSPLRIVYVVHIVIRDGDKILIEGEQRSKNQQRYRGILPSEKIKGGESEVEAAIRGLEEELQVQSIDVKILEPSSAPRRETRISKSYPDLHTEYVISEVEAEIDNLPSEDFWTCETPNDRDKPVKEHQWLWRHHVL